MGETTVTTPLFRETRQRQSAHGAKDLSSANNDGAVLVHLHRCTRQEMACCVNGYRHIGYRTFPTAAPRHTVDQGHTEIRRQIRARMYAP